MINTRRLPVWDIWIETWKDAAVVVATGVGLWSTWKGPPDPGRLSKLCASRAAYPRRFARRCGLCPGKHPLSEQIVDENGAVAFRTRSSHAQGSAELAAGFAAADADEPVATLAALVDRVSDECLAALKCLAHSCQIRRGGLMAEPVTALLVSSPTILRACRRRVFAAHQAAALTITRTLTHGAFGLMASRLDPPSAMSGARDRRVQRRSVPRAW
jgi:hypothetical protein